MEKKNVKQEIAETEAQFRQQCKESGKAKKDFAERLSKLNDKATEINTLLNCLYHIDQDCEDGAIIGDLTFSIGIVSRMAFNILCEIEELENEYRQMNKPSDNKEAVA